MNPDTKYSLWSRTLSIWAILFVVLITCPVKKAVKGYLQPPATQSYTGVYNNCLFTQADPERQPGKEIAAERLTMRTEPAVWGYQSTPDREPCLYFLPNNRFSGGAPPLYLQYRKILV